MAFVWWAVHNQGDHNYASTVFHVEFVSESAKTAPSIKQYAMDKIEACIKEYEDFGEPEKAESARRFRQDVSTLF
jgi:hypothetical protein